MQSVAILPSSASGWGQVAHTLAFSIKKKYKHDTDEWIWWPKLSEVIQTVITYHPDSKSHQEQGPKIPQQHSEGVRRGRWRERATREASAFFAATADMCSGVNITPNMSLSTTLQETGPWSPGVWKTSCMQDIRTAAHLAESLRSLLSDWDMGERELVCCTADNGTNIVAAERELGWPWLSCFGHNIHLSITLQAAHVTGKCKKFSGHALMQLVQDGGPGGKPYSPQMLVITREAKEHNKRRIVCKVLKMRTDLIKRHYKKLLLHDVSCMLMR